MILYNAFLKLRQIQIKLKQLFLVKSLFLRHIFTIRIQILNLGKEYFSQLQTLDFKPKLKKIYLLIEQHKNEELTRKLTFIAKLCSISIVTTIWTSSCHVVTCISGFAFTTWLQKSKVKSQKKWNLLFLLMQLNKSPAVPTFRNVYSMNNTIDSTKYIMYIYQDGINETAGVKPFHFTLVIFYMYIMQLYLKNIQIIAHHHNNTHVVMTINS